MIAGKATPLTDLAEYRDRNLTPVERPRATRQPYGGAAVNRPLDAFTGAPFWLRRSNQRRPELQRSVRVSKIIWLFLYMHTNREFSYLDAWREIGVSRRAFTRYLRLLREAGVVVEYSCGIYRYLCYDLGMAPILDARTVRADA